MTQRPVSYYTFLAHPLAKYEDDINGFIKQLEQDRTDPEEIGWVDNSRQPALTETQLAAFRDLIKDPAADVSDIAARLDLWAADESSPEAPPISITWMFWSTFLDAISRLPSLHERLLELVVAVHRLDPSPKPNGGYGPPNYSMVFTEGINWNSSSTEENVRKSAQRTFLCELFKARMALAGLTGGTEQHPAVRGMSTWLIRGALTLRAFLEWTPWDPDSDTYAFGPAGTSGSGWEMLATSENEEDKDEDKKAGEEGDVSIAAFTAREAGSQNEDEDKNGNEDSEAVELIEAEQSVKAYDYTMLFVDPWIKLCGGYFYRACKANLDFPNEEKDADGKVASGNFAVTHDGKGDFSVERWAFWRSRLERVAENAELESFARDLARSCLDSMAEIEREDNNASYDEGRLRAALSTEM